ncbi:histidine kinase dimerization/phosphoacceptor domain -containing protein, partial [Arcobacteraceae bacterium]|nr:histidine kinase dimerization/phosphoacceptor domain -containing protein [Arcobacteraceae bacterium]
IKEAYHKYTVSKLSNVSNIYTGNLTAKEVFNARNKGIIRHKLNGKPAISWVVDIYNEIYDGDISLLVKTVYEEDLVKQIDSSLLKILPAALISLLFAMIIGFFVFKKLFKTINILTDTAKEVNSGNKHIRSNVKGNDDIGNLGIAFDSMLDSFEHNIKNLDFTVKEKTTKLQNSLEEKEILLREIHHRVKNNLALTISLIKLQQEEITEEKTNQTLNTMQERIYTMELIHRKLYESTNLNQIDFNEYVHNLVSNISKTYSQKNDVNIDIQINNVLLSLEKAMPCGLILNEIITNAFKYAFPNNPQPKLSIQITKENDLCILAIQDNGKGINKKINIYQSNTLGLKLINSIAKLQLKGTFKYLYNNGALFEIRFRF